MNNDIMAFVGIIANNMGYFYKFKDIKFPNKDFFFNRKNLMNFLIDCLITQEINEIILSFLYIQN